jgi:hypothetical protein
VRHGLILKSCRLCQVWLLHFGLVLKVGKKQGEEGVFSQLNFLMVKKIGKNSFLKLH